MNEGIKIIATVDVFTTLRVNSPSFSGQTVPLFDSMLVTQGEGSGTPIEPHHTPSPQTKQSPLHDLSSSSHPIASTELIPTTTPIEIPTFRQYSRRATRIAQSKARPTAADEPASLLRDDIQELMDLCTILQRQQTQMATKINARDLEISSLMTRIKLLEDKDKGSEELFGDDAPIRGRSMEIMEEHGNRRGSWSRENRLVPTVSAIFTTASVVTPYTRRPREISAKDKGKEKMVESDTPKKKKLQEQIDVQVAREMEEEMAREDQRMNEQIARDAEIARIHAEEELKMMIDGMDRSNEMIAKHLHEYEQAVADLSIREKIKLINELTKHLRGMTLDEIREKFIHVWKQFEDFLPMASKEEGEIVKRKWLKLEQGSTKKMKTSEEVSEEDLKEMMQLVPVEECWYLSSIFFCKNSSVEWGREQLNRTLVEAARTMTKTIMDTMNVTFDELSAMDFEQRSSKPGFQSMTSRQITMYDDYIGGQLSAAPRTAPVARAPQVF
uniref:Uncharacterized protein n=1 Tax=Tanacetum cinerariifolium TaxID=118510 RepID=A0A6L2JLK4_TANCI|nr:hypothetical protein [Tanacetum cinerariifolium]